MRTPTTLLLLCTAALAGCGGDGMSSAKSDWQHLISPPGNAPHSQNVAVLDLGSDDDAREALDDVREEAVTQPNRDMCVVNASEFAVAGIPDAQGVALTPQLDPPPDAPPPFVSYGVGFTIGPRLYLVTVRGEPGQVTKSEAVDAARALYDPYAS